MVIATKISLYLLIHAPTVTLSRPKLASTIFICHINAAKNADSSELLLNIEHFI